MSVLDAIAGRLGYERQMPARQSKEIETPYTWPMWQEGEPQWTSATLENYTAEGYQGNAIIYACIARKAETAAVARLRVYSGEKAEPEPAPDNHPLAVLIERPNAYMSWYELQELLITYLELDGNCYLFKQKSSPRAPVIALYPLRPDYMRPVPKGGQIIGYVYESEGKRQTYTADEIIDVKYPNPGDIFEGLGRGKPPLLAAAYVGDVDNATTRFLKQFFDNAVVPFGLLKSKQKLLDAEVNRIRARIRAQYAGMGHWGDMMILDADAEYQRLGLSMQELGFDGLDARNEARICSVLKVPPILVGAKVGLDRSTFANYGEARTSFWEDTMVPLYRRFEQQLNLQLASEFPGYWLAYDWSDVPALRQDDTGRWETAVRAFLGGIATRNEARSLAGLPPTDAQRDGFRATEEQQIGAPAIRQTPPTVEPMDDDEEDEDADEVEEEAKATGPFASTGKAIPNDSAERLAIEQRAAQQIARALAAQWQAIKPTTDEDVSSMEQRLTAASTPLRDTMYQALRPAALLGISAAQRAVDAETVGAKQIGINWTLVATAVLEWLNGYSFGLVGGIDQTTRDGLRAAVQRWVQNGLPLRDLIDEIVALGLFERARAELIASTEVTRAYAQAQIQAWQQTGVITRMRWNTANDERVCFPAWTLVETENGPLPIQNIEPGMEVWTRAGLKRVKAISKRDYAGEMVTVRTDHGDVTATADHPFWTLQKGWLQGCELDISHTLQSFDNQPVNVLGVSNFLLRDAQDKPASPLQISGFAFVSPFVLVPVGAVNFQGYSVVGQQEVNAIATHSGLLHVFDAKAVEDLANSALKKVFTLKGAVTSKRTELPVSVTGADAQLLTAISAFNVVRRAAAFFRAIVPVQALFTSEDLSASLTGDVLRLSGSTSPTTEREAVSHRAVDLEALPTGGTDLLGFIGSVDLVAGSATEASGIASVATGTVDRLSTCGTGQHLASLAGGVVAVGRTEDTSGSSVALRGSFAAMGASVVKRHGAHLLSSIALLYHRLRSTAIAVYNLEIEDVPEYYANGILVHNCPICAPLGGLEFGDDGTVPGSIEQQLSDGITTDVGSPFVHPGGGGRAERFAGHAFEAPPAHPRCRCWLTAAV